MNASNRVLVGLDFTAMDNVVIRYLAFMCGIVRPDKIYFINIQHNLDVPEGIREKFPELNRPLDEKLKDEMRQGVQANFPGHENFDIEYDVIEGSPLPEMLRWAHIKNADLVVMGEKNESSGSGILAQQMTRKGTCSVLFVPEPAQANLDTIFVAVDFSENSKMALEEAWRLAEKRKTARLFCYHTYSLPSGYYKTGKTEAEFADIMRGHAEKKCNDFFSDLKIPRDRATALFELEGKESVAAMIARTAQQQAADLIIVGAKGRTNITAILLGSVAEKLIKLDKDIPLLVVKQKDKSFNFWDFIKNV